MSANWVVYNNEGGFRDHYCTIQEAFDDYRKSREESCADIKFEQLSQPYKNNELFNESGDISEKIVVRSKKFYVYDMPPENTDMHIIYIDHVYESDCSVNLYYYTTVLVRKNVVDHYFSEEDSDDGCSDDDLTNKNSCENVEATVDIDKPEHWE